VLWFLGVRFCVWVFFLLPLDPSAVGWISFRGAVRIHPGADGFIVRAWAAQPRQAGTVRVHSPPSMMALEALLRP